MTVSSRASGQPALPSTDRSGGPQYLRSACHPNVVAALQLPSDPAQTKSPPSSCVAGSSSRASPASAATRGTSSAKSAARISA